jgi:hypothetical protein
MPKIEIWNVGVTKAGQLNLPIGDGRPDKIPWGNKLLSGDVSEDAGIEAAKSQTLSAVEGTEVEMRVKVKDEGGADRWETRWIGKGIASLVPDNAESAARTN